MLLRTSARFAFFLQLTCAAVAQGQAPPDHIHGRVTDDSSRAVVSASVFVTRGPDRALKQTTTDSSGRYSLLFEDGTGDYLVAVTAPGLKTARRRVQRQGSERELVADFVLGRDLALLAAVKVTATQPVRATNRVSPYNPETGASEKWSDGVQGQLPPTVAGSVSAIAGTIPGVTLGPNGPAILGSGSESNLTTLNGSRWARLCSRAARTDTRVTGATFDPTRGGFSGANIDVRLGAGDRMYQQRNAFFTFDARSLQFTDAIGRATGAQVGSFRGSAGADGELVRQTLTYNVAVDYSRTESDPATLLGATPTTLRLAGVSADSVARLLSTATTLGIPLAGAGIPGARTSTALTWLARLDDIRDSLRTRTITTYAGLTTDGAQGFSTLGTPAAASERRGRTLGLQLQANDYFGPGRRRLNQARLGWNAVRTETDPYLALPGAQVLVRSIDGSDRDVATLSLGGGAGIGGTESRWTVEGANETLWNARGRRHTYKGQLWGRIDGVQHGRADLLGRYTFNSIADLAAGNPPANRTLRLRRATERSGTPRRHRPPVVPIALFGCSTAPGSGQRLCGRPGAQPGAGAGARVRSARPTRVHVSPAWASPGPTTATRTTGTGAATTTSGNSIAAPRACCVAASASSATYCARTSWPTPPRAPDSQGNRGALLRGHRRPDARLERFPHIA
jgi:hypothetical protein